MVFTNPFISKTSSPVTKTFGILLSSQILICVICTFVPFLLFHFAFFWFLRCRLTRRLNLRSSRFRTLRQVFWPITTTTIVIIIIIIIIIIIYIIIIIINIINNLYSFSHQNRWSLSDSKSPQVSRTLLSILAIRNNAVVWMVSTRPPTSKLSRPFQNPLVTVPKAPITIGIIVTFMFHSFFNSLARSRYLSFFSHFFSFILWSAGTAKSTILLILLFFFFFLLITNYS